MNSPLPFTPRLAPEDYLDREMVSPIRHEYAGGLIHAMTGASAAHNLIAGNLYVHLRRHLQGSPCRVFMADMKARLEQADAFYYPDVMVSCETPAHPYYRKQPKLIIEVLSSATARFDAGDKRRDYQSLSSLEEYVLVAQDCMDVRVWRRGAAGWTATIYTDGMIVPMNAIGLELPIEAIYEDVWS